MILVRCTTDDMNHDIKGTLRRNALCSHLQMFHFVRNLTVVCLKALLNVTIEITSKQIKIYSFVVQNSETAIPYT